METTTRPSSGRLVSCLTIFFDRVAKLPIYDKIIGNSPYGAWQDYDRRTKLKKSFQNYM
ncbi:hypothetical protein HMPREF3190_00469 [Umbribacter vaginalis]|nr:hypothetical protein HMPREF3190_00469 [Coriobacteriales bacterium DNF00809]